jgi:hypothetical protein
LEMRSPLITLTEIEVVFKELVERVRVIEEYINRLKEEVG